MNNLISDLAGGNSLFELSYELAADIIPLLIAVLAAIAFSLFLFWRKLINIPTAVLFVLSVVGISLDLIEHFNKNNIILGHLPEWVIFLNDKLSYGILVGIFILIVFNYRGEKSVEKNSEKSDEESDEKKRKDIYKKRLLIAYDSFRKSIIRIFISASGERYDSSFIEELSDYKKFRDYFGSDRDRWYFIADQLNDEKYSFRHDLIMQFELFKKEISNVLNSNISHNEESYNNLCNWLGRTAQLKLEYDNIIDNKEFDFYDFDDSLMHHILPILRCWNPSEGELKEDPIKEMIEKI